MDFVAQEALRSLWVALPVLAVFGVCEWLHRARGVPAEHTRKLSHVGGGLVVLALPWVVSTHWTVLALAGGFVLLLGASRPLGLLPSVHAVARRTRGAHYYPIAVWLTFWLAHGDPTRFSIGVLVMALSDTAAAVVGRRHSLVRYHVIDEDWRSIGGSLAAFVLTFLVVLSGLSFGTSAGLPTVLTVSLVTAMVATAVEGVSIRGLDNLLLPYVTVLLLDRMLSVGPSALADWTLAATVTMALLLASARAVRLTVTGFFALFLAGVLGHGLGGPVWAATLAMPYVGFVLSRRVVGAGYSADLRVLTPACLVSVGLLLAHAHTGYAPLYLPFVASVASVAALAWSAFVRHRTRHVGLDLLAAPLGAASALLPALVMTPPVPVGPTHALVLVACASVAPLVGHLRADSEDTAGRGGLARLTGVLGGTAAAAVWLLA